MRYNILLSSTIAWNPGDEFIRIGVKRLLGDHNYVVWNRNPDVMSIGRKASTNSIFGEVDVNLFDMVVFAGTPQWYGEATRGIYESLRRHPDIPIAFLGIGISTPSFGLQPYELEVLSRKNAIILPRSQHLANSINAMLKEDKAAAMPCPALFSKMQQKKDTAKTAFVMQSSTIQHQAIPEDLVRQFVPFFDKADIICLYIDEWKRFRSLGLNPIFCDCPSDYLEVLSSYQRIVSTRLHGGIAALSCGCTSFLVADKENFRVIDAQKMFGDMLPILSVPESLNMPPRTDILPYCEKVFAEYKSKLAPWLNRSYS